MSKIDAEYKYAARVLERIARKKRARVLLDRNVYTKPFNAAAMGAQASILERVAVDLRALADIGRPPFMPSRTEQNDE